MTTARCRFCGAPPLPADFDLNDGQHYDSSECLKAVVAERDALRDSLAETAGVLNALNERRTPPPAMSLRRSLVDVARRMCFKEAHQ